MSAIPLIRGSQWVAATVLAMVIVFPPPAHASPDASPAPKGARSYEDSVKLARAAYEREIARCEKREAEIEKEIGTIRKQQQELEAKFDQLDQLQQQTAAKGVYVYEDVLLTRDEMVALSIAMYGWHCKKRGKAWNDAEYDRAFEEIRSLGVKGREARLANIISEMNRVRDRINGLEEDIRRLQKERYNQVDLREALTKKLAALPGLVEAKGSAELSFTPVEIKELAGIWRFGRSKHYNNDVDEFICDIDLTTQRVDNMGYKLISIHPNESFWDVDGEVIVFKNEKGVDSTRFSRQGINHYEGEFKLDPSVGVKHYLKR